jgi:glucan phosphoethanolaminetransferase (alkaline phosphatase superfamily)
MGHEKIILFSSALQSSPESHRRISRAGHSLLFTLFTNRYSATSIYHFAIATPLFCNTLFAIRYSLFAIRYLLLPLTSLMGLIVVDFLNFN